MRVCFWATTFQSDNHALAVYLASQGHDVTVAVPAPAGFAREPINQLSPLCARVLDRNAPDTLRTLRDERFDVMVVDNHLPKVALAERLFVLWHGFGWRVDDLSTMRAELRKLVGDVTRHNPRFRWQAVGEWDREYRISHSEIDSQNVVALGAPASDWLRPEAPLQKSFDRASMAPSYSIDLRKKVVLVALTWHHGGSLGHWGKEDELLTRFVQHVASRGAVVLLRMHDRQRYSGDYVALVESVAARSRGALMLKWKNESPDVAVDLLVSDVCISNYSSVLNAFYYTERPTIHVDPHDAQADFHTTYRFFLNVPIPTKVKRREDIWKLPPEEHGGLHAGSFEELLTQVDRALDDPHCCRERSRAFVRRYVTDVDGRSAARSANFLQEWVG
jgi:CDP-Glycerol:Poly(glycerophosphate) glycerophosphotransferase